jgi:membrane-bound lytic murein transglycosylase D
MMIATTIMCAAMLSIAAPTASTGQVAGTVPGIAPATVPAAAVPPAADADPFPEPPALREGIAFWKRVWSEWTLSQVVLHDSLHHQIVYEVIDLPGPVGDLYTEEQRDLIKDRREALEERLKSLEERLEESEPLDDEDRRLAALLTTRAGAGAIEGARDRLRVQRGLRERFLRGVAISGRYLDEFKAIFREAGLPEDLAYLPHVESSFQENARSWAGAAGMWQFTRSAARLFLTMTSGVDERLDPVAAARGAARYLKKAFDELGSWPLAVTSYNHGIAGMRHARERFGDEFETIVTSFDGRSFGFASRNFYMSFVAARDLAKVYEASPPPSLVREPRLALDRIVLDVPSSAPSIARRYGVKSADLAAINPAWTRSARDGSAKIPAGVQVWLPAGTLDRIAHAARRPAAPERTHPASQARVHTVAPGETLSKIARMYGVPLPDLLAYNGLRIDSILRSGQRIRIPAAN